MTVFLCTMKIFPMQKTDETSENYKLINYKFDEDAQKHYAVLYNKYRILCEEFVITDTFLSCIYSKTIIHISR
jgi:hypothetical protein